MSVGKILAGLFCAAVLGVQSFEIFRTTRYNEWHWPFLNYPMYSRAHHPGEAFSHVRLLVAPCDPPTAPVELTFVDLHLIAFRFRTLVLRSANILGTATPERSAKAADYLRQQISRHEPRPMCRMEVEVRSFTVGPRGVELPGTPWHLARAWRLSDSAAVELPGPAAAPAEAIR